MLRLLVIGALCIMAVMVLTAMITLVAPYAAALIVIGVIVLMLLAKDK